MRRTLPLWLYLAPNPGIYPSGPQPMNQKPHILHGSFPAPVSSHAQAIRTLPLIIIVASFKA